MNTCHFEPKARNLEFHFPPVPRGKGALPQKIARFSGDPCIGLEVRDIVTSKQSEREQGERSVALMFRQKAIALS